MIGKTILLLEFFVIHYIMNKKNVISRGKSYWRITNKSFIKEISDSIPLDFIHKKSVYKFKGTYDIVHEVFILDCREKTKWIV